MRVLVVGGAGMIGGHIALRLKDEGHAVTVAGRNPPAAGMPLGALNFIRIDFLDAADPRPVLEGFDAMVFAAGNDFRHVPAGSDYFDHVTHANGVAQPRFFAAARDAGIRRAINIGSYYPHVAKHLMAKDRYMQSRQAAWNGISALADGRFHVVSLDAPFVMGAVPKYKSCVQYAEGRFPDLPVFAPPGGVNFVTTNSIADAAVAALTRTENGRAYLIGDENLTFQQFFGAFFEAVGKPAPPVIDREHPILRDAVIPWGRGNTLFFESDRETAILGYRRNDVLRCIRDEVVPLYRGS